MMRVVLAVTLLAASVSFLRAPRAEVVETISGYNMAACASKHCYQLKASKAYRGAGASTYIFDNPRLQIHVPGEGTVQSEHLASDGYYDPELQIVLMRNAIPVGDSFRFEEVVVHLKSGQIESF